MASIKQLRGRIRTAKTIGQITRAMKLVAAARLRRAQDRVLEARPYSDKMQELVQSLGAASESLEHPLLAKREIKRYGVILVTAERGLCGGFNAQLNRKAFDFVRSTVGEPVFLCVGKKGQVFFEKRGYKVAHTVNLPTSGPTRSHAKEVMDVAESMFTSGELDAIYLIYSKFYSAVRQVPQVVQLLPIEPPSSEAQTHSVNYAFEPNAETLLQELLPRYALTLILQALLESTASEHGARMTAMTNATDSASDLVKTLTLQANRTRQAAITKEILEIVAGADALKG